MSEEIRMLEDILRGCDPHLLIGRGIIADVREWIERHRDSLLTMEANCDVFDYKLAVEEAERMWHEEKKKLSGVKTVYVQKGERRNNR